MVDGINSAKGIQQQQAGHTIKKQESGPHKQNSIFNYTGTATGTVSGSATMPSLANGIEGTVVYLDQGEHVITGQTSGKPDVDLGRIGEAAVEGAVEGGLEGAKDE